MEGALEKGYQRFSMDVRTFQPGIYLLKIQFKDDIKTVKYEVR